MINALDGSPISPLTFGTMQFGAKADAAESRAMYDAARAAGITHFDTAYLYAEGRSEELLGQFIGAEREQLVIASKVGFSGGAGRANMLAQFDETRSRLGLEMVDILYLHKFDPQTPLDATMDAFATLHAAGQIRYVGLSNFAAWQVMKAQAVAARFDLSVAILQPMYNLVKRQAEVEILPMCVDQSIEIAPYSPLGGGLLTGKYLRGETGRLSESESYAKRYAPDWMQESTRGLIRLAEETGHDPSTLAVAWVMAHDSRPRPIVSARTPEQLAPSLAALSLEMTPELYERLSSLSPRPAPATDRLEEV